MSESGEIFGKDLAGLDREKLFDLAAYVGVHVDAADDAKTLRAELEEYYRLAVGDAAVAFLALEEARRMEG